MSAGMDPYQEAFLAESLEALDTMESTLLRLSPGSTDGEAINTIFRVAHSIKGGAGMLGYQEVASFTHLLETLLDGMRSGRLQVTEPVCQGLLQSVDAIRSMLASQPGQPAPDTSASQLLRRDLGALAALAAAPAAPASQPAIPAPAQQPATPAVAAPVAAVPASMWRIGFTALPGLLDSGNDPLRLFSDLAGLGEVEVRADLADLPVLEGIDPGHCRIRWQIELKTTVPRESIDLIFEWAADHCEVHVERIGNVPSQPQSIRVAAGKIDELLDIVGRIETTQVVLSQLAGEFEGLAANRLRAVLARLEADVRGLHYGVMRVRAMPVGSVFSRFPRLVHDLSARLGKQVQLLMFGEQTEMDKVILEKIGDPLLHLVRNSLDHGIETPAERIAAGKTAEGLVLLDAYRRGGAIHIVVCDDGRGLDSARLLEHARNRGLVEADAVLTDREAHDLIFAPGFSTAEQATELSGRGVGLDVVRRNVRELGGTVELFSEPGRGTTTTITLPLRPALVA